MHKKYNRLLFMLRPSCIVLVTCMAKCCSGPIASAFTGRKADLPREGEGENSEIWAKPEIWEGKDSDVCDRGISDFWDGRGLGGLIVDC